MMREFIEEFKIVFGLRHMLYLTNIALFAIVSFINWDLLWWWNISDWNGLDRIMFLIILIFANVVAAVAWKDFIKKKDNE